MSSDRLKKIIAVGMATALFAVYCIVAVKAENFGFDFKLRYNEVKCVLDGTDPLFIWNGTVPSSVYKPFAFEHFYHDTGLNLVHSYPTWAYTYLMPLVVFPRQVAMTIFAALEFTCVIFLFAAAFHWGFMRKRRAGEGCLCLVVVVIGAGEPMMHCLHVLNYGIMIAGAALGMIVCLNRGRDILAGFCWAFMMVKPQLALLFAVPLLMCGKWKTGATAIAVCLLAAVPPAVLCGRSPIAMIFSILEYSRGYQKEVLHGMSFVPAYVAQLLLPYLNTSGVLSLNALTGLVICCTATWFLRRQDDWLFRMLPSSVICVMWMAPRAHDQVCLVVMYVGAVIVLLRLLDKLNKRDADKKSACVQ